MSFSDGEILEALLRMKNSDKSMRCHDNIVAGSLIRRRVRLVSTDLPNAPLATGAEGWVRFVGDKGTLMVEWDRNKSLYQLEPGIDHWEWLGPPPPSVRFPDGAIMGALLRIKNGDTSMRHVDEAMIKSLRGRRVRLMLTNDEYTDLEPGDEGWVSDVDDAGTVFVRWDRVVGHGMIPGSDRWEWL